MVTPCEILLLVFPACHLPFPEVVYGAGLRKVKLLLFQKAAKAVLLEKLEVFGDYVM